MGSFKHGRAWQEVGQEGQQAESSWEVQANSPEQDSWDLAWGFAAPA